MGEDTIEDFDPNTGNSGSEKKSKKKIGKKFNPLFFHIGIIVILIVLILGVLFSNYSFFGSDDEKDRFELIGKQKNFSISYKGDLNVEVSKFNLNTQSGNYDGNNQFFLISNFSGKIYKNSEDIFIEGVSQNISYGGNTLLLGGGDFVMNSSDKTKVSFYLDDLNLDVEKGVFSYGDKISYNFDNASVNLKNSNTTMNYDGTFSFTGLATQFRVIGDDDIELTYNVSSN